MFRNSSRNKTLPCVAGYVQHSPREGQVVSRVGVVGPRPGAVTPRAGVVGGPRPGAVTPTAGVVEPMPAAVVPFRALGTAAAAASVVPVVGLASGNRARDTTTAAHLENFRSQRRELLSHREAASSIVTPAADETPGRVTARRRRCRGCGQ